MEQFERCTLSLCGYRREIQVPTGLACFMQVQDGMDDGNRIHNLIYEDVLQDFDVMVSTTSHNE